MLVPALEGYRLWADSYDNAPNPVVALESRTLASQLGNLEGRRVADIACGTGRWIRFAIEQGAQAIGVDRSAEMAARCPGLAVLADAASLPLADDAFDVTVCSLAWGYLESPMPELRRITKPGGSILVSDLHPLALDRGWKHSFRSDGRVIEVAHQRYSLSELIKTPGLQLVSFSEPRFGELERPIFQRAGKESIFAEMSEVPAVYVAHWMRV